MKVSQLNVGVNIALLENGNAYGYYTLVQKNYCPLHNTDTSIALLWRTSSVGTTQWAVQTTNADSTTYQSSLLDYYINTTWYSTLPQTTRDVLTSFWVPTGYGNNPGIATAVIRNASTVSAEELGYSDSGYYGDTLAYNFIATTSNFWTREPVHESNMAYYFLFYANAYERSPSVVTIQYNVLPTVGVAQDEIEATWSSTLNAYTLSKPINNVAPETLSLSGTSGNHITDSQVFTSYQLTWPAATGNVTGYYVERSGSDGTTRIFGPYTTCEAYADAPNQGYMTYTYSLYTEFDGVTNMVKTPVSCKVSSKNSKIWAYTPRYPGTGWSPNWYLATPKYYNGSSWQTCTDGVFCYTDSGKIRVYGSEISYDSWVEPVGTDFKENESGWWESQNKDDNTVSLCKIYIVGDGKTPVYIDYINSGENGYDYGLISALDTEFTGSETKTAATIYSGYDTTSSTAIRVLALGILPARTHYLYALYRKDSSVTDSATNDSLQFRVRFG